MSHINSTSAGSTRMQLAKVMIASVLVLAACAEGLPEGKTYVLKSIPNVKFTFDVKFHLHCLKYN